MDATYDCENVQMARNQILFPPDGPIFSAASQFGAVKNVSTRHTDTLPAGFYLDSIRKHILNKPVVQEFV